LTLYRPMMRAHQMVATQQPAELREVAVGEPGPGEILIKVGGAGLCHSDLHMMHWPMPVPQPFTLGHETAGWVEALGAGVSGFEIGEAVLVHGAWGCGRCRRCQADLEQYCEVVRATGGATGCGLGRDGGLAEYLIVPAARHLVPLGALDPRISAPLDDAALTPYHALKRLMPLCTPDNWVMVQGIGGLGHAAVQLVKELTGARLIAVDVSDDKLALATLLGADAVVRGDSAEAAAEVLDATHGQGVAAVIDCVGVDATLQLAMQSVHPVSHIAIVGIGMGTLPVSYMTVPFETTVSTTFWGGVTELREIIALTEAGKFHLHVEQIGLEDVAEGYRRLEAGTVQGRLVATPHG
jgi:alcohol dehydrogenase, propanol-preferring